MSTSHRYDLIVFGDEVESILTAVSAARMSKALQKDLSIALVRQSTGKLGGLSTRGGLSYMDITLETKGPLFREFLEKSGVIQVALAPEKAHRCLETLIQEENITVLSGQKNLQWQTDRSGVLTGCFLEDGPLLQGRLFIDATPDADMARLAGIPFMKGLGGVLGSDQDYLGVSPVFQIHGVPKEDLIAFEATLRQAPQLLQDLKMALPHHPDNLLQEYLTRPCYSPDDKDYLDILNPVIGVAYHVWRHGSTATYPTASIYIDGANISILPQERLKQTSGGENSSPPPILGFNGMIRRTPVVSETFDPFEDLLQYSHEAPIPADILEELKQFEKFLREVGGLTKAKVVPPEALYVRQTLTLLAKDNMTAEKALKGGVPPEEAIGSYSYWLDLRGTQLWKKYPGEELPKPIFNLSLDVCFPRPNHLNNLAFVGRSAGYSPIGQGAGRIVQHNAFLGEALGIASALANAHQKSMASFSASDIKPILDQRNGSPLPVLGENLWAKEPTLRQSKLLSADKIAIESLAALDPTHLVKSQTASTH